jgi:RNA polymerase sigma factor (sigma-70 family)
MTAVPRVTRPGDPPGRQAGSQASEDARDLEASLRDPEHFGIIFDRYFPEIHRYIARRLGRDAADDLAAETFLTAFRKRRRFDVGRGIVRAWLYGIATNHISRYQRSMARAARALARTPLPARDEGHADQVIDRVTAAASRPGLAAALAGLFAGDREVLLLVALGGLSHAEVAEALGIPSGTVGSRLSRARTRLRAALGPASPADRKEHDHG